MTEDEKHKYTMRIGLNVLNHLGIGLYSNVPAVLSEVVANAWDADADSVDIVINPTVGKIVIDDNGVGMTAQEINDRYLFVGYDKRAHEPARTPIHDRLLMGRKGIGKLAVFSIADTVEVFSAKGGDKNCLRMSAPAIKKLIQKGNGDYHPEPIEASDFNVTRGTRIVLRDLRRGLATSERFFGWDWRDRLVS